MGGISHCKENERFAEFCEKYGDEAGLHLMEEIADAQFSGKSDTIRFSDIYQHNATNHTLSGRVDFRGEEYHFIIESGDWNGTVVKEFETIDEVGVFEHPKPTIYTMVPANPFLEQENPSMWKVYLTWKEEPWFTEMVRKYSYDIHFQPGGYVSDYWGKQAAKKGLRFAVVDED
jgi:hypothetical protein